MPPIPTPPESNQWMQDPLSDATTRRNVAIDTMLNNGKGMAQILDLSPVTKYNTAYAQETAKNRAGLVDRQRAGAHVEAQLNRLVDTIKGAPDDMLEGAIGPYNTTPYASYIPFMGGHTVPELRAITGNAFGYNKTASAPYDLQIQINHLVDGLTTAFISSASRTGMTMSDSRQRAFEDTMGRMRKATNRNDVYKIANHARGIIRDVFGVEDVSAERQGGPVPTEGDAPVVTKSEFEKLPPGSPFIAADDPSKTVRVKR